ncbi:MAG: signal peptidase II [Pseudomonadales bacterium]|nr:signal peptidase II [Pseudomonadales bacterium]
MRKSASVNPHWWWSFVGAAALVVVDQYTKYVATAELLDGAVSVLPFLSFRYFCNTGAAFSILQGYTHFLTFVGVAFVIYFSWEIWRLRRIENPPVLFVAALTLILAGAGGNLIDRAMQGCVVDFIHVHYDWFNFPIFNVADSAVCIGAASWILAALLHREQPKSEVAE